MSNEELLALSEAIMNEPLKEKSLMVIQQGDMSFVGAVFLMADSWAEENYEGWLCGVRNTPQGAYEIFLSPPADQ